MDCSIDIVWMVDWRISRKMWWIKRRKKTEKERKKWTWDILRVVVEWLDEEDDLDGQPTGSKSHDDDDDHLRHSLPLPAPLETRWLTIVARRRTSLLVVHVFVDFQVRCANRMHWFLSWGETSIKEISCWCSKSNCFFKNKLSLFSNKVALKSEVRISGWLQKSSKQTLMLLLLLLLLTMLLLLLLLLLK